MPLFTSLDSFALNLSEKINVEVLKKALKDWSQVEKAEDAVSVKNKQLANIVLSDSLESIDPIVEKLSNFTDPNYFNEKTWVALHIACLRFPEESSKIYNFITSLLASEVDDAFRLQAYLFRMNQPNVDMIIVDRLCDFDDDWAFLTYLTCKKTAADSVEERELKEKLSSPEFSVRFTRIVHQRKNYVDENGKQATDSFFKVFVKSCGLNFDERSNFLRNIVKLTQNKYDEYEIFVLLAILRSFNDLEIDAELEFFFATFADAFVNNWTLAYRTDVQKHEWEKGIARDPMSVQQITQRHEFDCAYEFINDFIYLINVSPDYLATESRRHSCKEKMNEALKIVEADFVKKINLILEGKNKHNAVLLNWLMTLDIFVDFSWTKLGEDKIGILLSFVFNNKELYNLMIQANLRQADRPLFKLMVTLQSYTEIDQKTKTTRDKFNREILKDFFQQEEFIAKLEGYLPISSEAFKKLACIKKIEIVKIFRKDPENLTRNSLREIINASDADEELEGNLQQYVQKLKDNLDYKTFVDQWLGDFGVLIEEQILKNLFIRKYTLVSLSELAGAPEPYKIYIGEKEGKLQVVFKPYGMLTDKPKIRFLDKERERLESNLGTSVAASLNDPHQHSGLFNFLLTIPDLKNNIAPQDESDLNFQKSRKGAELKIIHLFELIKKVRKEAPAEYARLKRNLIFQKFGILYRYVKYSNHFFSAIGAEWFIPQKECLKYLAENMTALDKIEENGSLPFFQPVFLKSSYHAQGRSYKSWARGILFFQMDFWSRLANSTLTDSISEIGGRKFSQTLIYNLHYHQIEKVLAGTNIDIQNDLYPIAEIEFASRLDEVAQETADQAFLAKLDGIKVNLERLRNDQEISPNDIQGLSAYLKGTHLTLTEKMKLYQEEIYALLHLRGCLSNGDNQFLKFVEYNYKDIKNGAFKEVLLAFYEQPSQGHNFTKNMTLVENWFREVILKNKVVWKKENETAKVLMMFSDDFLRNLVNSTKITYIEIWNAAYPGNPCRDGSEYYLKRQQNMLQTVGETSLDNMIALQQKSSASPESSVDNRVPISSEKTAVTPSILGDSRATLYSSPSSSSSGSPPISPERAKHARTVGITPK